VNLARTRKLVGLNKIHKLTELIETMSSAFAVNLFVRFALICHICYTSVQWLKCTFWGPETLLKYRAHCFFWQHQLHRCVQCVLAMCGEGGLSRSEQLVGYFYSAPLLDVAYSLA